jgi:hypothetical protein
MHLDVLRFVPRVYVKLETSEDGNEFVLDDTLEKVLTSVDRGQMLDAPEPFVDCYSLGVSLLHNSRRSVPSD